MSNRRYFATKWAFLEPFPENPRSGDIFDVGRIVVRASLVKENSKTCYDFELQRGQSICKIIDADKKVIRPYYVEGFPFDSLPVKFYHALKFKPRTGISEESVCLIMAGFYKEFQIDDQFSYRFIESQGRNVEVKDYRWAIDGAVNYARFREISNS